MAVLAEVMRKTRGVGYKEAFESKRVRFFGVLALFLKRDIVSPSFCASVILVFLALWFSKDAIEGLSALSFLTFSFSHNNAMNLVALAVGVASVANFAQERTTHYARYILSRISRRRYLAVRFISVCISTGCVVFLAFFLFGLFGLFQAGGMILPSYAREPGEFLSIMDEFLLGGSPVLWFLAILCIQFMFGFVAGAIGIVATAFIPNRFIGYVAPFILLFVWQQVRSNLGFPIWTDPLGLARCMFGLDDGLATLVAYLAAFLVMASGLFLIFWFKGNREVKHGS